MNTRSFFWKVTFFLLCSFSLAFNSVLGAAKAAHPNPYVVPFSLTRGGEQLNTLVQVSKGVMLDYYYFDLIFVEKHDWPLEKRYFLIGLFEGLALGEKYPQKIPYPVRLRFQLNSMDSESDVHIDKVVQSRNDIYSFFPSKGSTWRGNKIYGSVLKPGIYRVRIKNLTPNPEIDFETFFKFSARKFNHLCSFETCTLDTYR